MNNVFYFIMFTIIFLLRVATFNKQKRCKLQGLNADNGRSYKIKYLSETQKTQ